MEIRKIHALICLLCLGSCYYGVNEQTTEICSIRTDCPNNAWDSIFSTYSIDRMTDSTFVSKIAEFESMPFPTDLIYFDEGPKEIIGISDERYAIRYVYNPSLGNAVLCGMDKALTETEKSRIEKRIQNLTSQFGCKNY